MLVLSFQVLNVAAVAAILPPHEGNVFTGLIDIVTATTETLTLDLLQDLSPATFVALSCLQAGDGVL